MKLGKLRLAPATPAPETTNVTDQPPAEATIAPSIPEVADAPAPKVGGLRLGGMRLGSNGTQHNPGTQLATVEPVVEAEVVEEKLEGPEGFKALLDRFDNLIVNGGGITTLTLDTARHYVADIYKELKENPEFDPLFVDRDMHNVMSFVQRSSIQATQTIQTKKIKAETRESKKAATTFDLSAFGDPTKVLTSPVDKAVNQARSLGGALDTLGGIDTDAIAAKMKKGESK